MMTVAANLLKSMPIVHFSEWHEDEWQNWLTPHLLNQDDDHWLSDSRGFIPASRRQWLSEEKDKDWRWQVWPNDFLESLFIERRGETWLNVAGSWDWYKEGYNETISISSRLVPSSVASSLQRTIAFDEGYLLDGYGLSDFDYNDHYEEAEHPLRLRTWYSQGDIRTRVDEFDPYSGSIRYPAIKIQEDLKSLFNLVSNDKNCSWEEADAKKVVLLTPIWSEDKLERDDSGYLSKGNRLQASLSFLKTMLDTLNTELIIQIDINRQLTSRYRRDEDDVGYTSPYRKVYILSKDGRLRDTSSSFSLREKIEGKP